LLSFFAIQLAELDELEVKLTGILKELEKEKGGLEKEIASRSAQQNAPLYEVLITLQANAPTECELHLAYITFGTGWEAFYDVRVISQARELEKLELIYYGNIMNSSGEDWIDCFLTLSTATPSIDGKAPPLNAKWVSLRNKGYYYSDAKPSNQNKPSLEQKVMKVNEQQKKQKQQQVTVQAAAGATSATFTIPRKATVLSDGKAHKVTIKTLDTLEGTFLYSITPSVSEYAYLKGIIRNTSDFPLLAGDLNVFMDSTFVAKSAIDLISPNESFGIFLGIDPSIKVDYRPTKKSNAASGVWTKTITEEIKDVTVVTNNTSKSVDIVVLQQLPRSTDSNLKVKLLSPDLGSADPVDEDPEDKTPVIITLNNHVRWRQTIGPSEKKRN